MSPSKKSELGQTLARLARDKGDQGAWQQVYNLLWPRVVSTTYRLLGGLKDRAEDAAQEVFHRLVRYTNFEKLRTPDEFLGYIHVMCENVAADFLKELMHQTISLEDGLDDAQQERLTPANPEQIAITMELTEKLRGLLQPDELILLQLLSEGVEHQEIATKFGWSYGKAGVRVHRLRAKVRKLLKRQGL